jgi:hypothetical protein
MTTLEQLESTVSALSEDELKRFKKWFREFDARQFDEKIENDIRAGKLDKFGKKAAADHAAGRTKPL